MTNTGEREVRVSGELRPSAASTWGASSFAMGGARAWSQFRKYCQTVLVLNYSHPLVK